MSIYSELLERVERGSKFKIDLVEKTLQIDGKDIVLEGNLIDEDDVGVGDPWEILEALYMSYKRSVPSEHSKGNKPYFKASSIEELSDDEIAFNEPRNYCQAMIEGYVLLSSLSGWLTWQNKKYWFWQSLQDKNLVVLREWI